MYTYKLTIKFSEWKQAQVGMEPSTKTTTLDGNDTTTLSHHPYVLCHFSITCTNMLCVFVVCRGLWKAVWWVVVGVWCMLMCMGSGLCCVWVQCSCHSEHGRYGLSCLYANTVECMSLYGMYSMYSIWSVGVEIEILLLLNMADMDQWKNVGWAILSWVPCSFIAYMNRLRAWREFCGVNSWQL